MHGSNNGINLGIKDQIGLVFQFSDIGLIPVLPKYLGVEIRDWDQETRPAWY
jgi:hypothetical protein